MSCQQRLLIARDGEAEVIFYTLQDVAISLACHAICQLLLNAHLIMLPQSVFWAFLARSISLLLFLTKVLKFNFAEVLMKFKVICYQDVSVFIRQNML